MIRALYTAATGMNAQETNIDVISNNLANVNTTGFKKGRADFQDLMYQMAMEPGAQTSQNTRNPSGIQIGLGVKTAAVQKVFTQGDLVSTGNELDMAIEGEGFFQIQRPDGTLAFTRSGNFRLNDQGTIVTPDGFTLDPVIQVPQDATSISIAQDGIVTVKQPGQAIPQQIGQITAVRFPNPAGLKALGQNMYEETGSSGVPLQGLFNQLGFGRVSQKFLETSNVSVVEQVVNMITAQRAYEANSKAITSSDDMLSQAINLKR